MTLLLITLPLGNSPETARFDYVLSHDGRAVLQHARCNASQLPKASGSTQEIVAVVPASALSWHQVQLPPGTLPKRLLGQGHSARLRAVLEGLLEDQLLDEPTKLHFALQPDARTDGPVWVAACERQWLRNALDVLQHAGCAPQRVVPEWAPTLALSVASPVRAHKPVLWITGTPQAARLVWTDATGVHILPVSEDHGLPNDGSPVGPPKAKLLAEPAVAQWAERLLHEEITIVPPHKRLLRCATSQWNLAQGELARRNPLLQRLTLTASKLWSAPHWRAARWAVLALAAIQLVGLNALAWQAKAQLAHKRAAIRNTLLATFPQTTVVVDAPLQMQRAVQALGQATGAASAQDLESLLGALGAAASTARTSGAPLSIEFVPGELRVKGWALGGQLAADFNTDLHTSGYTSRLDGDTLVVQPRSTP